MLLRSFVTGLLLFAVLLGACGTLRAAHLYLSGTEALERGDGPRAVADLEQAAMLEPDASEILNHLGLAYEAVGRPDDALRAYRRAVDLDCDNLAALHNLAAIEDRTGGAAP